MSYSFAFGTFRLLKEIVTSASTVEDEGLRESVTVIGFVHKYDHVACRLHLQHDEAILCIDTSEIGPCPFVTGWLFQLIGEVEYRSVR